MSKTLLIIVGIACAVITAAGYSSTQAQPLAQPQTFEKWLQKTEAEALEQVKTLPDKDINLGAVALILAKEYYPDIDVKKYLDQLDRIASELKQKIGTETNPEKIIRIMNDYLYRIRGLVSFGPPADEDGGFSLNCVLDNNGGQCLGTSILYLALAERLNLPIYAVGIPEHMFVRYDDGIVRRNIETVEEGKQIPDLDYIPWRKEPEKIGLNNINKPNWEKLPPNLTKPSPPAESRIIIPEDIKNKKGGYFTNLSKKDVIIELLVNYAGVYDNRNKKEMFKITWDKARTLNITKPYHWMIIGTPFLNNGDYETAIQCVNEAIKQDPDFHLFYFQRAVFYDRAQKYPEVEADISKAMQICPDNKSYYHIRGRNYDLMGKYNKALADFIKIIELAPNDYTGYFARGVVFYRKKEYDKSLKDLDKTIELKPDYAKSYRTRGTVKNDKGDLNGAIADYTKAIELEPDNTDAYFTLGYYQFIKGDYNSALSTFNKAIKLKPDSAYAYHSRANAKYETADYDGAIADYEKAIQLDPSKEKDLTPWIEKVKKAKETK